MELAIIAVVAIIGVFLGARSAQGTTGSAPRQRPNPTKYDSLIEKFAKLNGIPFELLKGVIRQESAFKASAINEERIVEASGYGVADGDDAIGLMQVRAGALTDYNRAHGTALTLARLFDPETNISVGSWYLGQLIRRNGSAAGVEMYNVGETGYLKGVRSGYLAKVEKHAASYA